MHNLHARTVFFVEDAERSLRFYKESRRAFVFQVSWLGFELILNQAETWTSGRIGHGRVFIGLDEEQATRLQEHIEANGIETSDFHWGAPTLVIRDIDENELFFWLPHVERDVSDE